MGKSRTALISVAALSLGILAVWLWCSTGNEDRRELARPGRGRQGAGSVEAAPADTESERAEEVAPDVRDPAPKPKLRELRRLGSKEYGDAQRARGKADLMRAAFEARYSWHSSR